MASLDLVPLSLQLLLSCHFSFGIRCCSEQEIQGLPGTREPLTSPFTLHPFPVDVNFPFFQIRVKPGDSQRETLLGPLPPSTCLEKWAPPSGQVKKVEKVRRGWLRAWAASPLVCLGDREVGGAERKE